MRDYAMLYEELALAPWGGGGRRSDPFQLGDADTYRVVDNQLSGAQGADAKFGLLSAITKVVADNIERGNNELVNNLRGLQQQLSKAATLNDLCRVLDRMAEVFVTAGFLIIN